MSTTITASRTADLQSLLKVLESLGVTGSHSKKIASVTDHLNAYNELENRHSRAAKFAAPQVDGMSIQTRLVAGDEVTDSELIDYAARATAAGGNIGPAAQGIIDSAQNSLIRSASDALRSIFPNLIEDLRGVLKDAGKEPANSLVRDIQQALKGIDTVAGRNQCDYWCMYDAAAAKWEILDRDRAEQLEVMNLQYAATEKARLEREQTTRFAVRPASKQLRNLRRTALSSSGYGGSSLSEAEVADYAASKATGQMELTR